VSTDVVVGASGRSGDGAGPGRAAE
jgi:hypothetical protein